MRGLDSKDAALFAASCGIISEFHSECIDRLLNVAESTDDGKNESARIGWAVQTLGKMKCIQIIPLCIRRIDFTHSTGYASDSDPVLGDYPFARCLANFEKLGLDAILEYLGYGNSDRESKRRLALFAYAAHGGYVNVRVKKGTVVDHAKSYKGPQTRKNLDEMIRLLQLSLSDLGKLIEA
jgi:hypothetical protein